MLGPYDHTERGITRETAQPFTQPGLAGSSHLTDPTQTGELLVDFNEVLGRLGEATDVELRDALAAIASARSEYTNKPATAESAAALAELIAAARQLAGERTRRSELADSQASALAELSQLTEVPAGDPAPVEPTPPPATPPTEPAPAPVPPAPEGTGPAVTAGAGSPRPLGGTPFAGGPPSGSGPAFVRDRTTAAVMTALPGANATDAAIATREGLATVFANRRRGLQDAGALGKIPLAKITWGYDEARHLSADATPFQNLLKVEAVVKAAQNRHAVDNALVAAGLCAPLEVLWDVPVVGDTDRPVRDSLARFGADRGGITYRAAVDGVTQTGGIGNWTKAQDVADPIVPKTCFEVTCPGLITAEVEAIYACLQFSNMSTRFDPELMDAQLQAQMVAHARIAENKILTAMTAGSKPLYTNRLLGAVRDILVTLDKVVAYYRNVHRLSEAPSLRAILPAWARNLIRADVTRQMVGDGLIALAVPDAQIDEWFRARNINITWHLDGINPADLTDPTPDVVTANQLYALAAASAEVPGFPSSVNMLLYREGDWLYLDGGELDLGIVRDSVTNSENRFQTFSEEFSAVTHRGIEPLVIYMQVEPTGQSAATVSTASAAD